MTEFGCAGQQGVTDWYDRGRADRLLQAAATLETPAGHQRSAAELGNGDRGEEDLVAAHDSDLGVEPGAPASADGRAEDPGVDEDPHDSSAAANASSSSSDKSSINSASIDANTGAADS
ncbi:MAG: hypothetical protein ACR2HM_08850 [Acidimicrobiales bacterium]